jgi:hypothetical protein
MVELDLENERGLGACQGMSTAGQPAFGDTANDTLLEEKGQKHQRNPLFCQSLITDFQTRMRRLAEEVPFGGLAPLAKTKEQSFYGNSVGGGGRWQREAFMGDTGLAK